MKRQRTCFPARLLRNNDGDLYCYRRNRVHRSLVYSHHDLCSDFGYEGLSGRQAGEAKLGEGAVELMLLHSYYKKIFLFWDGYEITVIISTSR